MKDNEKPVLLGGVTYDETNTPYQLETNYDDYEDEKYLQRASILFDYPYEKEENTFIGLGEIPNDKITINYYYPNKPIESNVRDLRKEQDIIARQAKANRVYVPEKQNNQRIDYINKPLMNNGLTYTPNQEEIEMKPKKSIKQEKNYEEIANWFYPNMPEKSQIQETKRIPLLAENNQVPIKYYDDYPTLADRNYVVKPVQESFTGGASNLYNEMLFELTDKIINGDYKTIVKITSLIGIDAAENLYMSLSEYYLDTPFAHKHIILNNYKDLPLFLQKCVKDKIQKQLVNDYGSNCVNTTKGIFFDFESEPSRRLSNNNDIKKFLIRNKQQLFDNGYIENDSIKFTDLNFKNAIGKADIYDVCINDNDEITLYVIDIYDFEKNSDNPLIQAGRKNQNIGKIVPYFFVYSVKIKNAL